MRRDHLSLRIFAAIALAFVSFAVPSHAQTEQLDQHLRDQYRGKTFLLRGFYSGAKLRYDSAGAPVSKAISGDWTSDGFVVIDDIHGSSSEDGVVIDARRLLVVSLGHTFRFLAAEQVDAKAKKKPVIVEIKVDLGMHNPSPEQADSALSRIFLTAQDDLANLVPDYWRPCVAKGQTGEAAECQFAKEILAVPGVASLGAGTPIPRTLLPFSFDQIVRVGNGVSPPRQTFSPNPDFSEAARIVKFQGNLTLGLIVGPDGRSWNVHILNPLGAGLDAQAVRAVEKWRFDPAEKEGKPVPVEIAVEVNFHLY